MENLENNAKVEEEFVFDTSSEALQERANQIIPRENGGKCVENVYLTNITLGESSKKKHPQITFTFQEKNEKNQVVGEQDISFTDPTKIEAVGNVTEDTKVKIIRDTMSRIKHIFSGYILDEKVFNERINGFIPWCTHKINALNGANQGVKCRLKLVYSGKYISIPNYPITFLSTEKREIPIFPINHQYDKFTQASANNAISSAPDPSSGSVAEGSF